jgi:transcriptional regulator with PAS, ATPase and Fis domain
MNVRDVNSYFNSLGGEEQLRLQEFVEIISQADRRSLEELRGKRIEREVELDSQIENCDRKIIQRKISSSNRNYNLTQAAHLLKVHRQTLYYWIKKGWLKPKRDSRNYPVCTVLDIENIIKWRNTLNNVSF